MADRRERLRRSRIFDALGAIDTVTLVLTSGEEFGTSVPEWHITSPGRWTESIWGTARFSNVGGVVVADTLRINFRNGKTEDHPIALEPKVYRYVEAYWIMERE